MRWQKARGAEQGWSVRSKGGMGVIRRFAVQNGRYRGVLVQCTRGGEASCGSLCAGGRGIAISRCAKR